ncbi:hypothetical protein [Atopobium sp. oral taxon 416]|uniref:hypothetical protein n=1 Tax=Atopobium sp. oral taxon 416 TaxID=712157 RepID=UPI001BACF64A|nr:hypothetical protein [Atopobium sp. oral taxon 416]QUC03012.1 hypothetical protein J4859_13595 [Atopobium sp. oral taxon 416]
MEKLPPLQKIYEAWSALADSRVEMEEDTAEVTSSNDTKRYTVSWSGDVYSSDDNASYWQGYAGYPVLAVLMKQGKLPLADALVPRFAHIDWNALNKKYKRDYAAAAQEAFKAAGLTEEEITEAEAAAQEALDAVAALPIKMKRKGRPAE